jgi:hypothetical protein
MKTSTSLSGILNYNLKKIPSDLGFFNQIPPGLRIKLKTNTDPESVASSKVALFVGVGFERVGRRACFVIFAARADRIPRSFGPSSENPMSPSRVTVPSMIISLATGRFFDRLSFAEYCYS